VSDQLRRARAVLDACRDDPALFNEAVLGRTLWSKQVEVCRSVAEFPTTLVPAGRAVGKSYLLAGVVLWWLYTRPNSLVITTGPDHRQVVTVLWKEIRRALRPQYVDGRRVSPLIDLEYDQLTTGMGSPQRLVVRGGTEWQAIGFAAGSGEGFSGQHAAELLVVVDEATGVDEPIWDAIHGLASTRLVAVGNPIRRDCTFHELCETAASLSGSATMNVVRISSLETPDAARPTSAVGMASKSFLDQMRVIHGEDSPWWRSNILGFFPGEESLRFLPTAWIDASTRPEILEDELWRDHADGPVWCGVDIAGGVGADRSVVLIRNSKQILEIFSSDKHGVMDETRDRLEPVVVELCRKWNVPGNRVIYDKGGLGRSFASYLENHGLHGAIGYFGAGKGGKLYVNRRTANAFAIRKRLDPNRQDFVPFYCGRQPHWPQLRQELAELRSPTMEVEEGQVKQMLESKEAMAARLHRSPDLLDALLMTFTYNE
jgi:phage terminase large subunit